MKLSTLETGSPITLIISNKAKTITMEATIKKILNDNVALITIETDTSQTLNFENVHVEMEYEPDEDIPYIWRKVQIVFYHSDYILKTFSDGVRNNRRDAFRVGVGHLAKMQIAGQRAVEVLVRDISMSGFSITDRKKILNLKPGDKVSIHFEDIGHLLDLTGRAVRTEEHEDMIIYGFEITNLCKDLSSYITLKQQRKKS